MGPGLLRTPAGISLRGGTSRRPLRASGGHALEGYDFGYDLVPFYMVTGSYPGSKTAAVHTAVTAEFGTAVRTILMRIRTIGFRY